jgi:hypothetical protein
MLEHHPFFPLEPKIGPGLFCPRDLLRASDNLRQIRDSTNKGMGRG